MRRIVKIAVRFLHTKTALCDRKDTQSRFAVNAARSIVCVETTKLTHIYVIELRFQCRTQHCVCVDKSSEACRINSCQSFNAARSIVCVETNNPCDQTA